MGIKKKSKTYKRKSQTEEGADTMNSNVGYAPLNLNLISNKQSKIVSSDNALRDVTPIPWSNEVITGNKKVILTTKDKK
jgi:hypothetical protein